MKKGIAVIWAVLITVILMGGAGGGAWYYLDLQNTKDKDVMKQEIVALESQLKDLADAVAKNEADDVVTDSTDNSTTEVDPYLYTNSTYGFTLQFNSMWKGYQMKQVNQGGVIKAYYVCVPTTDPLYAAASSSSLAGTVSLFALSVYTQDEWTAAISEEGPVPMKVGQSGNWIIGYLPAQDHPEDKVPLASNVKTVLATFKAI